MTLTESDLSELLAAVQAGDMTDTIRTSLVWVLQQLIEAELSATKQRPLPSTPSLTLCLTSITVRGVER